MPFPPRSQSMADDLALYARAARAAGAELKDQADPDCPDRVDRGGRGGTNYAQEKLWIWG